jgi:hypothetical protein
MRHTSIAASKLNIQKLLQNPKGSDDLDDDGYIEPLDNPPNVLYHVTNIKNLESIRKKGLVPRVGQITKSGHGDSRNPATPMVYLLDTIAPGIYRTLGKNALIIEVSPEENDVWFFTGYELMQLSGSNWWGETIDDGDFPVGIEPGDYYSESKVVPKAFYDYKGNPIDATKATASKKAPDLDVLKKGKIALSDEERSLVMKSKAVWHHGAGGKESPAVWKSKVEGDIWYVTNTHRAYQAKSTLQGAIDAYHDFIKSTASLTHPTPTVEAGISDVVYHFTSYVNTLNILKENRFALTFVSGSDDTSKPNKKYYYLSTTRSRIGSYHVGHTWGVLLKLNGVALRHNNVGNPVDYWGRDFRKVAPSKNEMEDRIWSDKPYIENATKYIDEIHISFVGIDLDPLKRQVRQLLIEAKKQNIPTYIYTDKKSATIFDKRRAIPLSKVDLSTKPKEPSKSFPGFDSMAPWFELFEKDREEHLSTEPFGGAVRRIKSLWGMDGFSSFSADVHNSKKGTPALHKIVQVLKKNNWDLKDFYKHIQQKWTGRISSNVVKAEFKSDELATLEAMITSGSGRYDYLMSKNGDDDWEFYQSEDGDLSREKWATQEDAFNSQMGNPAHYFIKPRQLGPTWLVHFTNADPSIILENGFKGKDTYGIGLTTHYKPNANPGDLAFAYPVDQIREMFRYGKQAVLFKVNECLKAYHIGDEEDQIIFDVGSVTKMYGLEREYDTLNLTNKRGKVIKTIPATADAIYDLVTQKHVKGVVTSDSDNLDFFFDVVDQYTSPLPSHSFSGISDLIKCAKSLPKSILDKYNDYPFEVYRGTQIAKKKYSEIAKGASFKIKPASWSKDEDEAIKFARGMTNPQAYSVLLTKKIKNSDILLDLAAMANDGFFDDTSVDVDRILSESEIILKGITLSKDNIQIIDRDEDAEYAQGSLKHASDSHLPVASVKEILDAVDDGGFEYLEDDDSIEDYLHQFGDTGYFFDNTKVLKDHWLIHFTNSDPAIIKKDGFNGLDQRWLGLTKDVGTKPGHYALAYDVKDINPNDMKSNVYGSKALVFKADEAVRAYHNSDSEYQVIFDVRSVDYKSAVVCNDLKAVEAILLKMKRSKEVKASNTFMQTLNDAFAKVMQDPSFQKKVISDARDYSEGMSEDEVLERAFGEIYPEWMDDLEKRGDFENNGLRVYRGIGAKRKEDIKHTKLGIYWTWDSGKAGNYSDVNTSMPLHVISALVSIDDIDLPQTLQKIVWAGYEFEESEREITLIKGRKIKLRGYDKEAKANKITAKKEPWSEEEIEPLLLKAHHTYPKAGNNIEGFTVGQKVSNTASISATFDDYVTLKDIREVPTSEFALVDYKSTSDIERVGTLIGLISDNERIDPLIVVMDKEGLWVLEGMHRLAAIQHMKIKNFPALIVLDLDHLEKEYKAEAAFNRDENVHLGQLYHGTHDTNLKALVPRVITNLDTFGSWLSDYENAIHYGPVIYHPTLDKTVKLASYFDLDELFGEPWREVYKNSLKLKAIKKELSQQGFDGIKLSYLDGLSGYFVCLWHDYKIPVEKDDKKVISTYDSLDAWLKSEDETFPSLMSSWGFHEPSDFESQYGDLVDKDDYTNEDGEIDEYEYGEAWEKKFKEITEDRFNDWKYKYKRLPDPMVLYRAVRLPDISNLNKKRIGVYWTDTFDSASPYGEYGDNKGTIFVLKAEVPKNSIDWSFTIKNNMNPGFGEDEQEINVKANSKIKVVDIFDNENDKWLGLSFEGHVGPIGGYTAASKLIKQIVANVTEEDFYARNKIDPDDITFAGSGDFGEAYHVGDNRILKKTTSLNEFEIAKKIMQGNYPAFVKIFDVDRISGGSTHHPYYILQDELDVDSSEIEDMFYRLTQMLDTQGLSIPYLGYFDESEYIEAGGSEVVDGAISQDLLDYMDEIGEIVKCYKKLGITTPDIRSENLGHDRQGKLVAFDIDEKGKKGGRYTSISSVTYYHGTSKEIESGKLKKTNRKWVAFDKKEIPEPFWLTTSSSFAKLHGINVYACKLHLPSEKIFGARPYLKEGVLLYQDAAINEGRLVYDALDKRELFADVDDFEKVFTAIISEEYDVIETKEFIDWAKSKGFEAAYVQGDGPRNLMVFNPEYVEILDSPVLAALKRIVADTSATLEIPAIKWEYPTDKELFNEIQTEHDIEKLLIEEMWPNKSHYQSAVEDLKKVAAPEELDPKQLKGRHIWKTYEDLVKTVKSFGGPKDPDSMLEAIKSGKPLPMPVVIRKRNGEMQVAGGATRSGIANLAGQKITALVIEEKKANEMMADRLEEKGYKDVIDEGAEHLWESIKKYFLDDGPKPEITKDEKFAAHLIGIRLDRIAKLRGIDTSAKSKKWEEYIVTSETVETEDLLSIDDIPKHDLIKAAQKEYDEWDASDEEDGDPEVGFGGICHLIADAMADILNGKGFEVATVSATSGDQHVWVVGKFVEGVYSIDISPYTYEKGAGYTWSKIPNVRLTESDLEVIRLDVDPDAFENYIDE